jgi:uncharacterized protein (DUF934 family)
MRQIIHQRELRADDAYYADEPPVAGARYVAPLADYLAAATAATAATATPSAAGDAVLLAPADEVEALAPFVATLQLIVVDFPKIGEGRGYTQARMLRQRYKYRGELRARGALKRDQLVLLARCGFDSFQLDPSEDLQAALSAFDSFTVAYQDGAEGIVHVKRRN